jgi:carbon-monoxide dehydrogenase medium subunit
MMRPASFEYHKAVDIEDAVRLLAEFGEEGRPIAGGQSLVPMMNLRLARPAHLVDINALPMTGIEFDDKVMRIGALVRHEEYARDPRIGKYFPAFLDAVHWIGHPTIRRHGSIGGSLSHADPTAELPAAAILYDASIVARSAGGERRIAAVDFFESAYVTTLEPGELLVAVEFPIPPRSSAGSFMEIGERVGDFAIASVGTHLEFEKTTITKAALVCCGADLVAIRAPDIEAFLVGKTLDAPQAAEAGRRFAAMVDPSGDHIASADYKRALIGELTHRAVETACAKALGNK